MLLKKKCCGSIKGSGCADGQKHRGYINKEVASSQTVTTYALMMSFIMDALEGRDVAMVDIMEEFLHDDMDNIVNF